MKQERRPAHRAPARRTQRVRRPLRWLRNSVQLACAAVLIVVVGLSFNSAQPVGPLLGHEDVGSGSMGHVIPRGSMVFEQPITAADLHAGETIVFVQQDGTRTVHVFKGYTPEHTLITRGVANAHNDPFHVSPSAVKARVVWHVPYLGMVVSKLNTSGGRLVAIFAAILLFIWYLWSELAKLWRRYVWSALTPLWRRRSPAVPAEQSTRGPKELVHTS